MVGSTIGIKIPEREFPSQSRDTARSKKQLARSIVAKLSDPDDDSTPEDDKGDSAD